MLHLGDEAQVVAHFSPFEDSVILTHDRCTVCAKRPIGSEIVLDTTDGTLCDEAQVEAYFGPFRDSANLDAT